MLTTQAELRIYQPSIRLWFHTRRLLPMCRGWGGVLGICLATSTGPAHSNAHPTSTFSCWTHVRGSSLPQAPLVPSLVSSLLPDATPSKPT